MEQETKTIDLGPQQIVIADRGWVWVGKTRRQGDDLVIENARTVRFWGTKRGLGELAEGGPTKDTKLDPVGTMLVPIRAIIGIIACKTEW